MATAAKAKQLSFELPNKVGLVHEISAALSAAKINIMSLFGIETGDKAIVMLITSDNTAANKLLKKMGAATGSTDVVTIEIPNKPGEFTKVSGLIAQAGIDIITVFGTAGSARSSMIVLKTSDDKKVLKLLNK
ncbi:MAG: hypothetical protein C0402_03760 [Thermodesulfovibrio sp.]|nr:hypothetical protein [Thermodesulfovibrio sp.]